MECTPLCRISESGTSILSFTKIGAYLKGASLYDFV